MNGYPAIGAAPGFNAYDWDPKNWDDDVPSGPHARREVGWSSILGEVEKVPFRSPRLAESPDLSNDSTVAPPFSVGMGFPSEWEFEHRAQLIIDSALKQLVQEHQVVVAAKVAEAVKADRKAREDHGHHVLHSSFDSQRTNSSWWGGGSEANDVHLRWADMCQRMLIKNSTDVFDFLKQVQGCMKSHLKMSHLSVEAEEGMDLDQLVSKTGLHTRHDDHESCMSKLVMRPMSKKRLCWDLLGAFTILYEIVIFPLQVFSLPNSSLMEAMSHLTSVFWTLDLVSQFFTGFTDSAGFMEMRFEKTSQNYACSWFIFDFTVVALDWGMMVVAKLSEGQSTDVASVLRFRRVARLIPILRALRLIRVKKYMAVLRYLSLYIGNEYLLLVMKMMKLLASLVILNHYICCGWYLMGTQFTEPGDSPEGTTWVMHYFGEEHLFAWRYCTALQWSLAQFTPSASEIRPMNTWERLYSLGVVLFGMAVSASFVSNITNTITQLRQYNATQLQQEHNLRQFLQSHQVSYDLTSRIWQFIRSRTDAGTSMRFPEGDAKLLTELPTRLLVEARAEVFVPKLSRHKMFKYLADMNMTTMYGISHHAMRHQIVVVSFEMFTLGQECMEMMFMVHGRGKYYYGQLPRKDEDAIFHSRRSTIGSRALTGLKRKISGMRSPQNGSKADPDQVRGAPKLEDTFLEDDHWACEACLWMPWEYKGSMIAVANSDVFLLDAAKFNMLVSHLGTIKMSRDLFVKDYNRNMELGIEIHDLNSDMGTLEARADCAFPRSKEENSFSRQFS